MPLTYRRKDREFSPSDAERITGVSVTLQRDWRRRGILEKTPTGKWTQFKLGDIIEMATKKIFADAGFSVQQVAEFAGISVLPTLAMLESLPGAVAFEGRELTDEQRARSLAAGSVRGASGRYLVMAKDASGKVRILRLTDLQQIDDLLDSAQSAQCTVLDCWRLAAVIAERAGLPIFTWEVTETKPKK